MACINIFKTAPEGAVIRDSEGAITSVTTQSGKQSALWDALSAMSKTVLYNRLTKFDTDFLNSLEEAGMIGDWKAYANELRLGLMSKIFTKGFTKHFGDWSNGKGEGAMIKHEPSLTVNGEFRMGANYMSIFGDGTLRTQNDNITNTDLAKASIVWVMPGAGTTTYVDKAKHIGRPAITSENLDTIENGEVKWNSSDEGLKMLSNLAPRTFTFTTEDGDTHLWYSVEHAYQVLKGGKFDAVTDTAYRTLFESLADPELANKLPAYKLKIRGKNRANSKNSYSTDLLFKLVVESLEQNPEIAKPLLPYKNLSHMGKGIAESAVIDKAFLLGLKAFKASMVEEVPSATELDDVLAQELKMGPDEFMNWLATTTSTDKKNAYTTAARLAREKGITAFTSDLSMLTEADIIYYHNDATKVNLSGSAHLGNVWDMGSADTYLRNMKRKIASSSAKLVNLKTSGGHLSKAIENSTSTKSNASKIIGEVSALDVFDELIRYKPSLLNSAYANLLGKKYGEDKKSQLLSAATDNAKELLLGEIRANPYTNGIITAMLILGHDLDTIIDFLHSPIIEEVLSEYLKSADQLDFKMMSWDSIKKNKGLAQYLGTNEMNSLEEILGVSESLLEFGGIRSLSENFKIESFDTDKIMDGVNVQLLYDAIKAGDGGIKLLEEAELNAPENIKIFDPNMMIYLHPQSRLIFKRLYEMDRVILPAIFPSLDHTRNFLTSKDRNMDAYKGVDAHMADMHVDRFFNIPVGKDEEGNDIFHTGELYANDGSTVPYPLNRPEARDKFILEFPDFIKKAKYKLATFGIKNFALSSMSFTSSFKSTNPILSIPVLESNATDPILKANIVAAIADLKTAAPIGHVNEDKINSLSSLIYSNLSMYALIVSSGKVGASSISSLFEDINIQLGKTVASAGQDFYAAILPGLVDFDVDGKEINSVAADILKPLITNNVRDIQYYLDIVERGTVDDEADPDAGHTIEENSDPNDYFDETMAMDAFDMEATKENPDKLAAIISVRSPISATNLLFKMPSVKYISDEVFLGIARSIPYRIFKSANAESNPKTLLDSDVTFDNIPSEVLNNITRAGMQVGFDARLEGQKVRILGFLSRDSSTGIDKYLVADPSRKSYIEVEAPALLVGNPTLALFGHVIADLSERNFFLVNGVLKTLETYMETFDKSYNTAEITGIDQLALTDQIKKAFLNVTEDALLFTELKLLNASESVVTLNKDELGTSAYIDEAYIQFESVETKKWDKTKGTFLVPSFRRVSEDNLSVFNGALANKLLDIVAHKKIGEPVIFYFNNKTSDDGIILSTSSAFKQAFADNKYITKKFTKLENSDIYKVEITKLDINALAIYNGKEITVIADELLGTLEVKVGKGVSEGDAKLFAIYRGLDKGIYDGKIVKNNNKEFLYINVDGKPYIYLVTTSLNGNMTFTHLSDKVKSKITFKDFVAKLEKKIQEDPNGCSII